MSDVNQNASPDSDDIIKIKLEEALSVNRQMQLQLLVVREKLEKLLTTVKDNYKANDVWLKEGIVRTRKRGFGMAGAYLRGGTFYLKGNMFFKDINCRNCPNNPDYEKRKSENEIFPMDIELKSKHVWSTKDKQGLVLGIKEQIIDCLKRSSKNITVPKNEINSEKLVKLLNMVPNDFRIDWDYISSCNVQHRHTAASCQAIWDVFLYPKLKRSAWTNEENEKLLYAARKYKFQNWQAIAQEVGQRSDFQCLVQYQNYVCLMLPEVRSIKWTKDDDARLLDVVAKNTIHGVINWSNVMSHFPHRAKTTLQSRYNYTLDPEISHAAFTPEEDLLLLAAVKEYGTKFNCFPRNLFPNRTVIQLRSRYKNTLVHRHIWQPWTLEDDYKLMEFVTQNGCKSWLECSKFFEGKHTRTSCRTRFHTVKRFLEKNPDATLEQLARKCAKPMGSITTQNWKAKLKEFTENPEADLNTPFEANLNEIDLNTPVEANITEIDSNAPFDANITEIEPIQKLKTYIRTKEVTKPIQKLHCVLKKEVTENLEKTTKRKQKQTRKKGTPIKNKEKQNKIKEKPIKLKEKPKLKEFTENPEADLNTPFEANVTEIDLYTPVEANVTEIYSNAPNSNVTEIEPIRKLPTYANTKVFTKAADLNTPFEANVTEIYSNAPNSNVTEIEPIRKLQTYANTKVVFTKPTNQYCVLKEPVTANLKKTTKSKKPIKRRQKLNSKEKKASKIVPYISRLKVNDLKNYNFFKYSYNFKIDQDPCDKISPNSQILTIVGSALNPKISLPFEKYKFDDTLPAHVRSNITNCLQETTNYQVPQFLPPNWSSAMGFRALCIHAACNDHEGTTLTPINDSNDHIKIFRERLRILFYTTALLSRLHPSMLGISTTLDFQENDEVNSAIFSTASCDESLVNYSITEVHSSENLKRPRLSSDHDHNNKSTSKKKCIEIVTKIKTEIEP